MDGIRTIPDRLLEHAVAKHPRIIRCQAAAWIYRLDAVEVLVPDFWVPHGVWRRGPYDHQRRRIDELEIVEVQGMLVTSVRQTLADLCAVVDLDIVERAAESALRRGLVNELALREFADREALNRHGAPGLREVLRRRDHGEPPTGSDLETQCVQVWRRGGVPRPRRQWPIVTKEGRFVAVADFGFYPRLFVVENDGSGTHTPGQLQYDLNRQNDIADAGYDLRRFTYADVIWRPAYVCRETLVGLNGAPIAHRPLQMSKRR